MSAVVPSALAGKRIVLGVTGGIAAYKAIEVCRRLVDAGAHVVPVMTAGAEHFVGRTTFSALASEPVQTSLWDEDSPIPHTRLGQSADLILVAPATARLLAAYAAGLSTDLLTNTLLATRAPVVVCPAMHTEMWEHPAVQDNLATLRAPRRARGRTRVGTPGRWRRRRRPPGRPGERSSPPSERVLGSGPWPASGCSSPPAAPASRSTRCASSPTAQSGKQGYAIAAEAAAQGAQVTLVSTVDLPAPAGATVVRWRRRRRCRRPWRRWRSTPTW